FPEMLHSDNLNIPLLAYGSLAGGILTGKYLDPERFNVRGPDQRLGQDEWDNYVATYRGKIPEDWGYLSYGPRTGKCNKYPDFYHTHRSVWCQWKVGEMLKVARSHGLSMTQLALGWVYSRPFVGSTLIGPRTIGQLRESVRTLNYPILPELEESIHEIFLRYRAPTMGGPQILSSLDGSPKPQHDYIKYSRGPIWSGGTFWPNFVSPVPQPILPKKIDFQERYMNLLRLMAIGGVFDDPTDSNWRNFRLWKERLEENRPGEYFAVKESKLFGWTEKKFSNWNWHNRTEGEKQAVNTDAFHFVWKNGKVTRENSSPTMLDFYNNEALILALMREKIMAHQDELKYEEQLGKANKVFNSLDFDLIDKELREKHHIDILNKETLRQLYSTGQNLTEEEMKTIPYWYVESGHPDSVAPQKPPGSFF
ncbi:oxidoreductase, aldo/keto reductase family protein, partial [Cardiosporidium cionae]